ncbi:MAG: hypothetical protein M1828_002920 [Chrysothrix sp. TS-e1954]|nr:MAG: hypothetical protein M1828_002920 [Chrysothrix sp. TS-e1954]
MPMMLDTSPTDLVDRRHSSSKRKRHHTNDSEDRTVSSKKRHRSNNDDLSAQEPSKESTSPFCVQKAAIHLPLSPVGIRRKPGSSLRDGTEHKPETELEAVCAEHLSPLLLTYSQSLRGIVLSYHAPRLSNSPSSVDTDAVVLGRTVDEYCVSYVWVIADFVLLRLQRGTWIEGHITVQNESYIALVCWNLFNASIAKKNLPQDWQWVGDKARDRHGRGRTPNSRVPDGQETVNGSFMNSKGEKVEGRLQFRVRDFEGLSSKAFSSVEGTLMSEKLEKQLDRLDGLKCTHYLSSFAVDSNMRLRLSIERYELPVFKLIWRTPEKSTTVSKLLELLNDSVPLESNGWGIEDYSVSVHGYECLHYQEVQSVLCDLDEVTVRALETTDVRARSLSGRYQISSAGAHLVDGVPFGKPCLKRPNRPQVYIPPLKRRRLDDDSFMVDEHGSLTSEDSTLSRLRILTNGQQDVLEDGSEDGSLTDGLAKGSSRALQLVGRSPMGKRQLRSDKQQKTVQFDDEGQQDRTVAFDIYEDDSDDEGEDYEPDASGSSSSNNSNLNEDGVDENEDPTDSVHEPGEVSLSSKKNPQKHLAAEDHLPDEDSSSTSSSSESESSDSSSSNASSSSVSSSSASSANPVISKTRPRKGPKQTKIGTRRGSTEQTHLGKAKKSTNGVGRPSSQQATQTQTPPGQGKRATKRRNERRVRTQKMKTQLKRAKAEAMSRLDGTLEVLPGPPSTISRASSNAAHESLRDRSIDHALKEPGTVARDASATEPASTAQTSRSDKVEDSANTVAVESSPIPVDEPRPKRAKLDMAGSRRLLFSSLGVRTPKSKADEDKLRERMSQKNVKSKSSSTAVDANTKDPAIEDELPSEPLDPNLWKHRLSISAVECVQDNVYLSAPPFPFVQRWWATPRASNKKQKRKLSERYQNDISAGDFTVSNPDEYLQDNYPDTHHERSTKDEETVPRRQYQESISAKRLTSYANGDSGLDYGDDPAGPQQTDDVPGRFPAVPSDPSSLPKLTRESCNRDSVIVFKQLEVSKATKWQPQISTFRRARVYSFDANTDVVTVTFAFGDRLTEDSTNTSYDEYGNRLYDKFEGPDDSEGDDQAENDVEIRFDDLIEARLLLPASDSQTSAQDPDTLALQDSVVPDSMPPLRNSRSTSNEVSASGSQTLKPNADGPSPDASQDVLHGAASLPAAQQHTQLSRVTLSDSQGSSKERTSRVESPSKMVEAEA